MEPIIITCGDETVQFTNSGITVKGTEYPYSGISHLWHIPQQSAYAFAYEGQTIAFPYEEKNAPVLQALFARIGQALHLTVEEYQPPEAVQQTAEETEAQPVPTEQPPAPTEPEEVTQPAQAKAEEAAQEPSTASKPADKPKSGKAKSSGIFSDRLFVIELVAGILLIILGIVGFILHG